MAIWSMHLSKDVLFQGVLLVLFGAISISLFLPNAGLLTAVPLLLVALLTWLSMIPWGLKISRNMGLYPEYWQMPSWWTCFTDGWVTESDYNNFFQLLGFGSMKWLHMDCISAFLGVCAVLVTAACTLLKELAVSMKTPLRILMMVLLIASGFHASLCVAYFFTFCAITEGV